MNPPGPSSLSTAPRELSLQLYTMRTRLAEDFADTLAQVAHLGYTQVEPFALLTFLDELRTGLPRHGLAAPTAHVGLLTGDQDAIFAAAAELSIATLIEPHVPQERWRTEMGVAGVAAELNAAAERAEAYGVRVGYHNHSHELRTLIGGRHALEVLVDHLAPGVVLEVDTYWAYAGGADVVALLGRLGERVTALHIKDGDGSLDIKRQVAVGAGVLPVRDYLAAAPGALPVVELDDSESDLLEAVGTSRRYLLGAG